MPWIVSPLFYYYLMISLFAVLILKILGHKIVTYRSIDVFMKHKRQPSVLTKRCCFVNNNILFLLSLFTFTILSCQSKLLGCSQSGKFKETNVKYEMEKYFHDILKLFYYLL